MDDSDRMRALELEQAHMGERMKAQQAEYKTDIARLAEDAAKREMRLTLTVVGVMIAAVTIIGVLID